MGGFEKGTKRWGGTPRDRHAPDARRARGAPSPSSLSPSSKVSRLAPNCDALVYVIIRRAEEHVAQPWKNGGGVTSEIAREPMGSPEWEWRLSLATVAADGPFSLFPGIDRQIALVDGAGAELIGPGWTKILLPSDGPAFRFSGDEAVSCRLIEGTVHDLNLMLRRSVVEGSLELFSDEPVTATGRGALVLLRGAVQEVEHVASQLQPRDAVLLEDADTCALVPRTAGTLIARICVWARRSL